ncbi:MAG: hypothetical protein EA406_06705 [Rhodospirillales bacterium]|nr:MAG: hypothetical protein EA406_06705 [Rhodospirillales bacterium]
MASDGWKAAIELIHEMMADPQAGWTIGTFGALAEYSRVARDPAPMLHLAADGGVALTARGGLQISVPPEVRLVAYEGLSQRFDAWTQTLSFCLPQDRAGMGGRAVLTELGPDVDALRAEARHQILFDLGIGARQVDFCVRSDDPALIRELRKGAGSSFRDPRAVWMEAVKQASPHRVCRSRLGRIEVYQPIPSRRRQIALPAGPHTHLLPDLLTRQRTRSANAPIPEGWVPVLGLHPGSPITDTEGRARPFDPTLHRSFQRLLERHGPPGYMEEKVMITSAVIAGIPPDRYPRADTRSVRKGARIALRQMLHTHPDVAKLDLWLAAMDRGAGTCGADPEH